MLSLLRVKNIRQRAGRVENFIFFFKRIHIAFRSPSESTRSTLRRFLSGRAKTQTDVRSLVAMGSLLGQFHPIPAASNGVDFENIQYDELSTRRGSE